MCQPARSAGVDRAAGRAYLAAMSDAPDIHDLARQVAVLEERMNTKQAEQESALDRLRADMAQMAATLTERQATLTERDATGRWWQTAILSGVIVGAVAIATAIVLAAVS